MNMKKLMTKDWKKTVYVNLDHVIYAMHEYEANGQFLQTKLTLAGGVVLNVRETLDAIYGEAQ